MNLPKLSIERGPVLLVAMTLLVVWGVFSYLNLPKREYPDVEIPVCVVVTIWPGATPEKMERMISEKIEDAAARVENIEKTTSMSRTGISVVYAYVDTQKLFLDHQAIWDDLRKEVDRIRNEMPEGLAFGPFVDDRYSKMKSMLIGLASPDRPYNELIDYAEALQDEIQYLDTVNRCDITGNPGEVIYLTTNERFAEYDITLFQVMQILKARNITLSGGALILADNQMVIEPSGEFTSLDDISDVILTVSKETGHPVYLRDLFAIRRGFEDPPRVMAHVDGLPAVMVDVELREGANVLEMGEQVRDLLDRARKTFPEDIRITLNFDKAAEVREKLDDFKSNLYQGILLVVAVALLAIGLKPALIMAAAIPLSMLITFGILPLTGFEIENMVITGLIVAVGMVVDNAVVITDNIYRYMAMGVDRVKAGWQGASEVAAPMLSATLTTVAAFLPLAYLPGSVGAFIRPIPIVIMIALIASYLAAMTVTPWMSSRMIRVKPGRVDASGMPRGAWAAMGKVYERIVRRALRMPWVTVAIALAAFVATVLVIPRLGFQFFPLAQKNLFLIEIWAPEGTSVPTTREIAEEAEKILEADDRIADFVTYTGKGAPRIELGLIKQEETPNYAMIWIRTQGWRATETLAPEIRKTIRARVPGARCEVKLLETGPPAGAPIAFAIQGNDIGALRSLSERIQAMIAMEKGTYAIHDDFGTDAYKIDLAFDEDEIKRTGLTNQEIALTVMAHFSGLPLTRFREEDKSIPIMIRAADHMRDDFNDLLETRVRSSVTGREIALKQVASIQAVPYVPVIHHKNGRRTLQVLAFVEEGVLADTIVKNVWPKIREMKLPEGCTIEIAGEFEEREKAFGNISRAFVAALLLMILVLMLNFNSLARTAIIFSSIPLSLIGSVLGLYITGYPFGFMAFLGVVSLSGIVVNNAIILIDFIDHAIGRGIPAIEAITQSGRIRMRAIMVTTATTIGGLIPLGLNGGPVFAPMAWVIMFGLAVSTLLTLLVVPSLYYLMIGKRLMKKTIS